MTRMIVRCLFVPSVLALLTVPIAAQDSKPQPPSNAVGAIAGEIYKNASPAVVLIETYNDKGEVDAAGSGFLVSSDGRIITNYHVIAHKKRATVRLANKDAYDTVDVLDIDKRKDIALLKIRAVDVPTLPLGKSSAVDIGDEVFSVSNPLGLLQNTLSNGIVSGIRAGDGYRFFQVTAPISHGSSGGPILNRKGEVIGIAAMTIEEGQNLNFAIPIDYAKGMLQSNQPKSLAAVYEPPDLKDTKSAEAKTTTAAAAPREPVPDYAAKEIKDKGIFPWLEGKLLTWTSTDAAAFFGPPHGRRLGVGNPVPEILAYADPTGAYQEIEILFSARTGKATHVFVYPFRGTWEDCKKLWGDKVKVIKNPSGTRYYSYKDRRIGVLADANGNVINLGVYALE